jgi:ABC-type Fe3+ transport system substrate-binding protein
MAEPAYPSVLGYLENLKVSGANTEILEAAVAGNWKGLAHLEYFLKNLASKPNGKSRLRKAFAQLQQKYDTNTAHHHWHSLMSELTAFWLLETKLNCRIVAFDIQSPFRER